MLCTNAVRILGGTLLCDKIVTKPAIFSVSPGKTSEDCTIDCTYLTFKNGLFFDQNLIFPFEAELNLRRSVILDEWPVRWNHCEQLIQFRRRIVVSLEVEAERYLILSLIL